MWLPIPLAIGIVVNVIAIPLAIGIVVNVIAHTFDAREMEGMIASMMVITFISLHQEEGGEVGVWTNLRFREGQSWLYQQNVAPYENGLSGEGTGHEKFENRGNVWTVQPVVSPVLNCWSLTGSEQLLQTIIKMEISEQILE